jgi:hypothetical protein
MGFWKPRPPATPATTIPRAYNHIQTVSEPELCAAFFEAVFEGDICNYSSLENYSFRINNTAIISWLLRIRTNFIAREDPDGLRELGNEVLPHTKPGFNKHDPAS